MSPWRKNKIVQKGPQLDSAPLVDFETTKNVCQNDIYEFYPYNLNSFSSPANFPCRIKCPILERAHLKK